MDKDKIFCEQELLKLNKDDRAILNEITTNKISSRRGVFFRIKRIGTEKGFRPEQGLENVYAVFRNVKATLAYYVHSDGKEIYFYLGAIAAPNAGLGRLSGMLRGSFCGNFRGAKISDSITDVYAPMRGADLQFSTVLGVPSMFSNQEERNFQSVDRLIHAMSGKPFHLVMYWRSVEDHILRDLETKLMSIYGKIVPLTIQQGSHSQGTSHPVSGSKDISKQESDVINKTSVDKSLIIWQKSMDDEILPRIKTGKAKGMYLCGTYLGAKGEESLSLLEANFISVYQSDSPSSAPLFCRRLPVSPAIVEAITYGHIFTIPCDAGWLALRSRLLYNNQGYLGTLLTARELGFMAGMPHADVPGLETIPRVSFGLNPPDEKNGIYLGSLLQDGGKLAVSVRLAEDDLERHIFIAGTTGAGKTTTCHRILREADCGFLVIEPAKTEYRSLVNDPQMTDLFIFTPGNESGVPFRINPFEFMPGEKISAHIDMLKACFMASFSMEAAMPNMIEEAMYKLYDKFGWDISANKNRILREKSSGAWDDKWRGIWFPTLNDYLAMLIQVIKNKNLGERLENEYIGSLRGRLETLIVGVKGRMLNTRRSVDFLWLLDQKAVIELEELKAGEDKAFVMSLIVGRLLEALKIRYRQKSKIPFRHVLLLEEAHRLLTRLDFVDNPCRRMGVEIFTDMLAEVRKYHESLIIVDQIPAKLAPEVLKNTNTKIAHRLFAEDDKRVIGETMALSQEQRDFLSLLDRGQAIIYGNGWPKPAHVAIEKLKLGPESEVDEEAFIHGRKFWENHKNILCPDFPEDSGGNPTPIKLMEMCDIIQKINDLFRNFAKVSFADWREFVDYAIRKTGGTYANEFLQRAIKDELLAKELILNNKFEFDLGEARKSIRANADRLLSGSKRDFERVKSILI